MADMYAKYGTPPDIEDKPEWQDLQLAQEALLEELHKLTGTPEEVLFESVQQAMFQVMGIDEETTLSREQAQEIISKAVEIALLFESREARDQGLLN
jgi:hypothetical protein